jgi:hypothetical protein
VSTRIEVRRHQQGRPSAARRLQLLVLHLPRPASAPPPTSGPAHLQDRRGGGRAPPAAPGALPTTAASPRVAPAGFTPTPPPAPPSSRGGVAPKKIPRRPG